MKMKLFRLTAFCLTLIALNLTAGSDEESKKWIAKMAEVYQKAPLSLDISADMNISQGGMSMTAVMGGDMVYADQKHYKMNMNMNINIPQQGEMKTTILSISDGTTVWTEMENPMMGGKQVMKLSIEKAEEFAEQQVGISGMGGGMDPAKMVEAMEKMLDIKFDGIKEGKAHLIAELTPESAAMFGQSGVQDMKMGKFIMKMDEKNVFPMEMVIHMNEQPMINIRFHNLKHIKKSEMDMGLFQYTPPEGVQVMDLEGTMNQMQQQ